MAPKNKRLTLLLLIIESLCGDQVARSTIEHLSGECGSGRRRTNEQDRGTRSGFEDLVITSPGTCCGSSV